MELCCDTNVIVEVTSFVRKKGDDVSTFIVCKAESDGMNRAYLNQENYVKLLWGILAHVAMI